MAYQFYLTDGGRAAIAQALSGDPVKITTACFGKGGGVDDGVDYSIAELKNPVTEKTLDLKTDMVSVDKKTGSVGITVELPSDYSGLMNEIGYKDDGGTLILYGVVPEENIAVDPDRSYKYTNWIAFENKETEHIEFSVPSEDYRAILQKINDLQEQIDNISVGSDIEERIQALEESDQTINSGMETLTQSVETLNQSNEGLEERMGTVEASVTGIEDLTERVVVIEGLLDGLKETLMRVV